MTLIPRDTSGWWRYANPLAGLTLRQAQSIYDSARRGCSPLLHRVYDAIEAADPLVMTCVERRSSALAGLGWRVTARAGADKALAAEQRAAAAELADGIGDLAEAVEHLDLAFFRGFSIVQPVWEGGGVRRIVRLDSWNFMRAPDGAWLWNPDCRESGEGLEALGPDARLVAVSRPRAIDYPAMGIHIRKALGERDWGRFVERYGIPPVDAVMGAGTTEEQRGDYLRSAEAARDGRSVVWPAGTSVSRAEGARGQDPFTAFVEHQEKLVVLMATGGTLTSLAQADTGSLAGGAQMDVWEQIVRRDSEIVGAALDRALFRPYLKAAFPGRPVSAVFELGREASPTADEVFETAGKARTAGYVVVQAELEEASGFKLERESADSGLPGGFGAAPFARNARKPLANPLQNARTGSGATDAPKDGETRLDAILDDFAAKLAEEMQDEMFSAAAEALGGGDEGEAVRNAEDQPRGKTTPESTPGSFAPSGGGSASDASAETPAKTEGAGSDAKADKPEGKDEKKPEGKNDEAKLVEVGSRNPDTPEVQTAQIEKANAAFAKCLETHEDVTNAFSRGDIGNIDVRWGKSSKGLRHLVERRDAYAAAHPGEMDGRQTLARMAETIIKGEVAEVTSKAGHTNVAIEYEGFRALLTRDKEGGNHWVLSGYEISDKGRGYREKKARQG